MNQRVPPLPPSPEGRPRAQRPPPPSARDREFLPAALEILERPPAPLPVALMLTICAFVAAALAWSFIGRLDVDAVALGKIETTRRPMVIQPLDPGKIIAIHVENGSPVAAGDLLLELDPAETLADEQTSADSLDASEAEVTRRRFAIDRVTGNAGAAVDFDPAETIAWDAAIPQSFRSRETAVLKADLSQLSETLTNIDKQMEQKQATRSRLKMSIAYQNTLIDTLNQRVGTREESIELHVGTKINLYDAKETLEKSQASLASDQGQLIETDAALAELASEKVKARAQFVADNESKLADAARKADEARQALNKARARLARTRLYAPIDGVVQQMAVTTIGQVVTTGQQLIVLTPRERALQVEALVANIDIGFVKLGQEAVVKVDAFPFTRFGVLHGKVTKIASEAVDEVEAKRALANATASANSANAAPSSPQGQPQNFVFPVTLSLDETAMKIDEATIPLTSGMTVAVEIKTDSRRVIDYLLSPLAKVTSEAMRER